MIFDCPRCNGENVIPADEIPPDGKVVLCTQCQQPFRVLPPEGDDDESFEDQPTTGLTYGSDDTGPLESVEATAIGNVTPFFEPRATEDLETRGLPLEPLRDPAQRPAWARSESPRDVAGSPESILRGLASPPGADLTRPLEPSPVEALAGEPPLEATQIPDLPPDPAKGLGRRGRRRPDGSDAADDPEPPEPGRARSVDPTPPSGLAPASTRPGGRAPLSSAASPALPSPGPGPPTSRVPAPPAPNPVLGAWGRLPLPVRVGILVFPFALGAVLVARGSGASSGVEPLPLTIDPQPSAVVGATPDAGDAPEVTAEPRPTRAFLGDAPAETGFAFVRVGEARLRSQGGDGGEIVGRLRAGSKLRLLSETDGQAVVLVGTSGPVGFVAAHELSPRLPLVVLADQVPFEACAPLGGPATGAAQAVLRERDTCVTVVESAGQTCLRRCESEPDPELLPGERVSDLRARCKEACTLRQAKCLRGCEGTPRPNPGADEPRQRPRHERRPRRPAPLPGP